MSVCYFIYQKCISFLLISGPLKNISYNKYQKFSMQEKPCLTFSPPCCTVGMRFFSWKAVFGRCQACLLQLWPNNSIYSSAHCTFFQKASLLAICSLANCNVCYKVPFWKTFLFLAFSWHSAEALQIWSNPWLCSECRCVLWHQRELEHAAETWCSRCWNMLNSMKLTDCFKNKPESLFQNPKS